MAYTAKDIEKMLKKNKEYADGYAEAVKEKNVSAYMQSKGKQLASDKGIKSRRAKGTGFTARNRRSKSS